MYVCNTHAYTCGLMNFPPFHNKALIRMKQDPPSINDH